MQFYKFSSNSAIERKWTFAVYIHSTSPNIHWRCTACGRAAEYPSGSFDVTVEGGSGFPDILGCGSYPFLIVSESVVTGWEKCGITTFHSYPVNIASVLKSRVRKDEAPHYYRIEVNGECRVNFAASGAAIKTICG